MKFKSLPVLSVEDATVDLEQLQGFLTSGDIGVDSSGKLARVTKINGTTVPLTGSAWIAPSLLNSWTNTGAPFSTAGYLKDPLGFVHLKGTLDVATNATVAFVLPAGYRPGSTNILTANGSSGAAAFTASRITLDTSGNVICSFVAGTLNIGIDGITFLAEN